MGRRPVERNDDDPDEDRYRQDNLAAILDIDPAMMSGPSTAEAVHRINKDLREAARRLTWQEARFLVDSYYQSQRDRIRAGNQIRAAVAQGATNGAAGTTEEIEGRELAEGYDDTEQAELAGIAEETERRERLPEPNDVLKWLMDQRYTLEKQVARALNVYSEEKPAGRWMRSITGVGPIIAAGLLAHIDIRKARTAGNIWRFAGLDPTVVWMSGEKRPWNADLKRLCYLIGESFVKTQNTTNDTNYGALYAERKRIEQINNENGHYAAQAAYNLETRNYGQGTIARQWLEQGKLPPGHIHQRARRYATKRFLSDLQCVWWFMEYGQLPERPYQFVHLEHVHYLGPPHTEMVPGLTAALKAWKKDVPEPGVMRPRNWAPDRVPSNLPGAGKFTVWSPPTAPAKRAQKDRVDVAGSVKSSAAARSAERSEAKKKAAAAPKAQKKPVAPKKQAAAPKLAAKPRKKMAAPKRKAAARSAAKRSAPKRRR